MGLKKLATLDPSQAAIPPSCHPVILSIRAQNRPFAPLA